MTDSFDFAVIGAGMAGASLAAELAALAPSARILLAEGEDTPGYHTTGRSAAFWEECYGGPHVVPLTLASGPFLREGGFLAPRAALYVARAEDEAQVDAFMQQFAGTGVTIERLGRAGLETIVPGMRPGWDHAISEPHCADIDVAALHQHYLGQARRAGVTLRTRHRLVSGTPEATGWRLDFGPAGETHAGVVVNAAGAWADEVAKVCGVQPLGIAPFRRTVAQIRVDPQPPADLPMVLEISGGFYFRPENGRLWLSPHDEIPSAPCDAAPEELDVALAIDRFQQAVDWRLRAVERKWAGLRSFAPDRLPVYGFDARRAGFFWCAGQGGYGIQTAPAGARVAAQVLLGLPRDPMTGSIDAALYAADRFG